MGTLSRWFPVLPLIGGKTQFQPVYVGDVAEAIAAAAAGEVKTGRIYELGGPETMTYRELMQRVLSEAQRNNPLLPVPAPIGKLLAAPFAVLPFPPLITGDQVELLQADNVVSEAAHKEKRTLAAFGIEPTPLGAILPTYLWRFRRHGQFDRQVA
jgi:NADH dehydrogenase